MLKRRHQLRLSLAAKCQILFGAAVVLIIAAALAVPWQRIEQLTEQLDERTAAALAQSALEAHSAQPAAANPATSPADASAKFSARIIGPDATTSSFERRAVARFQQEPDEETFWRYHDAKDTRIFRYAQALHAQGQCLNCHVPAAASALPLASTAPSTQPATLLGILSIQMPSQVKPAELLLNRVFILTAGLLAGTLAIVVFYLIITRLILQPVRVLQETAEKVSSGDLNIRSDINTGDEFQQLSETFNTMLVNLKATQDQLHAINKSLDMKLEQLAETNVALYESNRLKSEFLANVSHELRTPLNSILGFADLLKDTLSSQADPRVLRYVQNILSSGRNLLDLINDLLDLAKIEAGRMVVRSEPLSLNDLFEGLTSILKPLSEQKNLSIVTSVAADVPIIHTDPAKLQQILYNFLSNAIKFSPPGAQIDLAATREDEHSVRVSVADRGPGIEPDKHQVIFEKFRQIDASHTRQHGGSGLGLAISKELALLLSGAIGVRSLPGQGATFWITLPLKIQPSTQDVRQNMVLT